jgi:hypothetical protein
LNGEFRSTGCERERDDADFLSSESRLKGA